MISINSVLVTHTLAPRPPPARTPNAKLHNLSTYYAKAEFLNPLAGPLDEEGISSRLRS